MFPADAVHEAEYEYVRREIRCVRRAQSRIAGRPHGTASRDGRLEAGQRPPDPLQVGSQTANSVGKPTITCHVCFFFLLGSKCIAHNSHDGEPLLQP